MQSPAQQASKQASKIITSEQRVAEQRVAEPSTAQRSEWRGQPQADHVVRNRRDGTVSLAEAEDLSTAQPQLYHSDVSLREPSVSIAAFAGSDRVAL